jgi:hypothetical protein
MHNRVLLSLALMWAWTCSLDAQAIRKKAELISGAEADRGHCTVQITVDENAQIEIRRDTASIQSSSGGPPELRRFQCTGPVPANPKDFKFLSTGGRGKLELLHAPQTDGSALVRIDDPDGGLDTYSFDISWGAPGPYPLTQHQGDRYAPEEATKVCQQAVREQAVDHFHNANISFRDTHLNETHSNDASGATGQVTGVLELHPAAGAAVSYPFSCAADLARGSISAAQIDLPNNTSGIPPKTTVNSDQIVQACQNSVKDRLSIEGYANANFQSIQTGKREGAGDFVTGNIQGIDERNRLAVFDFTCAVSPTSGDVKSVDVTRRTKH